MANLTLGTIISDEIKKLQGEVEAARLELRRMREALRVIAYRAQIQVPPNIELKNLAEAALADSAQKGGAQGKKEE